MAWGSKHDAKLHLPCYINLVFMSHQGGEQVDEHIFKNIFQNHLVKFLGALYV